MGTRASAVTCLLAVAAIVACGGGGSSGPSGASSSSSGGASGASSGNSSGSATSDIVTDQQLALDVESAATAYGTTMGGTAMTLAACQGIHGQYDAQVRPWVERMVQLGAEMDAFINGHGAGAYSDMGCAAATLLDELNYHRSVACTYSDVSGDQTEASRHVNAMTTYAGHVWDRCGEMLGGVDGGHWSWAPMMNGCAQWAGSCCSSMMHMGCCGGTTGHMMGGSRCCSGSPDAGGGGTGGSSGSSSGGFSGSSSGSASGSASSSSSGATEGGTDPAALGQRIFNSGIGVDGQPIPYTGGAGMDMMNDCASCHGLDGHGRQTMMFTAPDITYANLTDPAGMLEPDGTRGSTYTDALIQRAVVHGIGADGASLNTTMPRWQLGTMDWEDLLVFLKTLP